ncbi:response regulator [Paenibacillus agaridevorans]|uniref:response regulator n=1 Tax=Paenibacillus agaridevorans TaxID=171404 RepID=UPI001BE41CE8|nr:response regulator [Paenibacillus agaridevorans]
MMLRLMIADDENLFREALRKSISWEELGYEICCEAENGDDALRKIHEFRPHVALVDINMPFLDGIGLAAEIKENNLNVCVIIITGYEEFTYARQAIEVGVDNYLLKPIDEEQLIKSLLTAKKKITRQMEELKMKIQVHKPLLKELLLHHLLQGTMLFSVEDSIKLKNSLAIDPDTQPYRTIVMEIADSNGWSEEEKRLWAFAVSNVAREMLQKKCRFEICMDMQYICVVVQIRALQSSFPIDVAHLCDTIRSAISKYLKLALTIGISNIHEGFGSLPRAYEEAVFALNNSHLTEELRVIQYGDIFVLDEQAIGIYSVEQRQQLLMAARMNNYQEVAEIVRFIFSELKRMNASSELMMNKSVELVSTCFEFIQGTGHDIRSIYGEDNRFPAQLYERKPLDQRERWVLELFRKAMHSGMESGDPGFSKTVEQALQYIDSHLGDFDLNIMDIARHVYIGYGRLCELFKRETGSTINSYITEARICKAKKLIDEGCHSVAVVASRVGYSDANYFGKRFKKKYGIAPGKYIDNKLSR